MSSGVLTSIALAQSPARLVDVHCHLVPPAWLAAMDVIGRSDAQLGGWSVSKLLDDMDKGGVATAVTSPTTPQVTPLGKATAVRVCRESNDYAKRLEIEHPGRFGTFAMIPLPYVDEALKEIEYALDVLKVDGIGVMTSYRDKWLGDPMFGPVWDELNRRKATVYTHPATANCCVNLVRGVPDRVVEYGADTTRSIASLILSGVSQRFENIKWIWSHGGGVLTAVAERFQMQLADRPPYKGKITAETINSELRGFYYDTAQISNAVTLSALAGLVPVSQILYGTDFPYRTSSEHSKGVAAYFKAEDLAKVQRENALKLFPRLGFA